MAGLPCCALLVVGTAVTTAHLAATGNFPLRDLAAGSSVRPLIGAAAYLVLVVSPLLDMITEEAKYLPSIARAQLYDFGPLASSDLVPLAGGAVMLGWFPLRASPQPSFQRRDA